MNYSVLMTVYNGDEPDYLIAALDSLKNQTLPVTQLIIVIDGQIRDGLFQIITQYEKQFLACDIIYLEKNIGLGKALNAGLSLAKYDYVGRMDADDICVPERFEKQLTFLSNNPNISILGSDVIEFNSKSDKTIYKSMPRTNDEVLKISQIKDPFNHPSVVFKKDSLLNAGGYSDLRKNQDTELWLRMLFMGYQGANINQALLFFRFNIKTYIKRKNWINTKILIGVRYKYFRKGYVRLWGFIYSFIRQIVIFITPKVILMLAHNLTNKR